MAALRLQELGLEPLVFEAESAPRGLVATVERGGWRFELGCATLAAANGTVARLLAEAVPEGERIHPGQAMGRRYLVHQGRLVEVPDTPAKLVATPLLSLAGRMRLLREPFVPRGGGPEETVAAFACRRFGVEMARVFFEPLLASSAGGDPEQLLARFTLPTLVEHERRAGSVLKGRLSASRRAKRLGRPTGGAPWSHGRGVAAIAAAMADRVRGGVIAGSRVTGVRAGDQEMLVTDQSGQTHPVAAVLSTVGAPALGRIDFSLPGRLSLQPVASMPHASLVVVGLGFRREAVGHPLDGRGVLAAASEKRRFLAIQFSSSQFANNAPPGHVAFTLTLGGARNPAMINQPDEALVEVARQELADLLGVVEEPLISLVQRWPAALPLPVAGHPARLAVANAIEEAVPRLAFAGLWRDGLAVGDVMSGGVAAVDRLVRRLGWRTELKEAVE